MSKLKVAFIGQNSPITLDILHPAHEKLNLVAIIESAPRNFDTNKYGNDIALAARKRRSNLFRLSRRWKLPYFLMTRQNQHCLRDFIKKHGIELVCISSMSHLIKEPVLSAPKYGFLNFHPSLLPNYRGPNPFFWQYYNMERDGGVSIIQINKGEDTGDIICQESFPIYFGMPLAELQKKCLTIGAPLLIKSVLGLENGTTIKRSQKNMACPFRARALLDNESHLIPWSRWPIEKVWHIFRGAAQWRKLLSNEEYPTHIVESQFGIGNFLYEPNREIPGTIGHDEVSYYIAHPQGKIRLFNKQNVARPLPTKKTVFRVH